MSDERVLVVDDDAAILTLCQHILAADGFDVTLAKRGEEALARLEEERFDLLLTDIRLPGLTGLDITRELRGRGLDLTVITMTGYSNMEMAIQALSLGVDEFIVKPFTPDTLRIHVKRAMDKTRLRGENVRLRALVPLLETARRFAAARTRERVVDELLSAAVTQLETPDVVFLRVVEDADTLQFEQASGQLFEPLRDSIYVPADFGLETSYMVQVRKQGRDAFPPQMPTVPVLFAFPVSLEARLLGVLLAGTEHEPSPSNLEAVQILSTHAAEALENVTLVAQLSGAYEDAVELERLKSDFINIAGHELRTPLAVILGNAVLLKEHVPEDVQGAIQELMEQAERLQRIANDMLSLKYLEDGQVELRLEPCAIDQVITEVVSAYQPLASERAQSIETRITSDVGVVRADRAMVDLMLGSLLSNAIKFSPHHSTICVRAEGEPEQVTLQVQDQGTGLSREQARHVFEPFYQADHSLTRRTGGLGFGLTLARAMVQAHHGQMWVESKPESGSTFYISLPRNTGLSAPPPP